MPFFSFCVTCISWVSLLLISFYNTPSNGADISAFGSWTQSNSSLPTAECCMVVAYDEALNDECIWVVGGRACAECFYCYNITSNNIYTYDTLNAFGDDIYNRRSSLIINDTLYFIGRFTFSKYNFSTKAQSVISSPKSDRGALVGHPTNDSLLFIIYDQIQELYIYNIDTGIETQGPNLTYERLSGVTVVDTYSYQYGLRNENDPYVYVIGGDSIYIERLNMNELNEWEVMNTTLLNINGSSADYNYTRHMVVIMYQNYILILCGRDNSQSDAAISDIIVFDVKDMSVSFFGNYALKVRSVNGVFAKGRIYMFGGDDESSTRIDSIYYSDEITFAPTNVPTLPTNLPSIVPTLLPTAIPSDIPSVIPTVTMATVSSTSNDNDNDNDNDDVTEESGASSFMNQYTVPTTLGCVIFSKWF